jgi:hypothetical protein
MISEANVRETMAPDDHTIAESPTLELMVTMVADPSKEVVGALLPRLQPWSCLLRIGQFLLLLLALVVSV